MNTTYVGADAETVEQSVATPIEQQMSGVDNMNYMYSLNANNGTMRLTVSFDVDTNPNTDLMLTQIRQNLAESQLPADVRNYGVTVQKALSAPLMIFSLFSPNGTYDATFLANYAYINIVDQLLRDSRGRDGDRMGCRASMRCASGFGPTRWPSWASPFRRSSMPSRSKTRSTRPVRSASEPSPAGQEFTYTVQAQGRLVSAEEFGRIVLRANSDGSIVRLKDVARIELGAQIYNIKGRLNGKPAANIAVYQLPGTNAIEAAKAARKVMEEAKSAFSRRPRLRRLPSTRPGRSRRGSARSSRRSVMRWCW